MRPKKLTIFLLLEIFSYILLLYLIIYTYYHPASNYELSIYEVVPYTFWVYLVFNILAGVIVIFYCLYFKNIKNIVLISALMILILSRLIIQWLFFLRGYYTLSGDHSSHVGIIMTIISSAHVPPDDFYPLTHILLSSMIQISKLPLLGTCNYSTAMVSILSAVLLFILSNFILKEKYSRIVVLTSSIAIIFDRYALYLMPNGWSIFFLPVIFYLFFRDSASRNLNFKVALIIIAFMYPFFHPLSSVYLILAFSIIGFMQILVQYNWKTDFLNICIKNFPIKFISLIFISFFMWIISFRFFRYNIRSLYSAIISGTEKDRFLDQVEVGISKLGIDLVDFIFYIFKSMGHILILLSIAAISLYYFVRSSDYKKPENLPLFALFAISGLGFVLYTGRIFGFVPGAGAIAGQRFISYVTIFIPVFIGYLGGRLLSNRDLAKYCFLTLMILLASIISIFAFFPSPYLYTPSPHITNMDMCSYSWTLTKMDETFELSSIISTPKRYIDLILEYGMKNQILLSYAGDHFGYEVSNLSGSSIEANRYIVLNEIDKITYSTVWRNVGRFNESDFEKLSNDVFVYKLYDNGGGDVWIMIKS